VNREIPELSVLGPNIILLYAKDAFVKAADMLSINLIDDKVCFIVMQL
jgi:hypothetical protein